MVQLANFHLLLHILPCLCLDARSNAIARVLLSETSLLRSHTIIIVRNGIQYFILIAL
jgi:acyl-CoA synthetase (AMP-forming)/AMP-acid ligase II